jgi:aryl-alcohol dehydrogenase-like predicted oxidoreductase/NAD-dependent dihydropyrimidine dehydrogenase PreA subunit
VRLVQLCGTIEVSELCYGTLTLGPLQKGLTPKEGGRLLRLAFELGVNFFDTAELYGTYAHLAAGLAEHINEVVIATKSYAPDAAGMEQSLAGALRSLNRDYIDIFLLHEQESLHTLRGHAPALEFLLRQREAGTVRAVGISTHHVAGVRAALQYPEIEVVHPLVNKAGIGIVDGSREDMAAAVHDAAKQNKGVYAMKALGGGSLYADALAAISYVRALPGVTAVALGMGSPADVYANCALFSQGAFPADYRPEQSRRRLHLEPWCSGCGLCTEHCPQGALSLAAGKAVIAAEKCVLCGYCVARCPDFNLKVI